MTALAQAAIPVVCLLAIPVISWAYNLPARVVEVRCQRCGRRS